MTLDRYRPLTGDLFKPLIGLCIRAGIHADIFSIMAFLAAIGAGVAFYRGLIALALLCVFLNAVFDGLDGALARAMKTASPRGDVLDHVLDRYADICIITGIFAGGAVTWFIGVFALTGVLMSSYMGTQAQAVGIGRYYGGLLGRADRLVLLLIAGCMDLLAVPQMLSLTFLGWLLLIFGVLGHYTAIQRFVHIWREMR